MRHLDEGLHEQRAAIEARRPLDGVGAGWRLGVRAARVRALWEFAGDGEQLGADAFAIAVLLSPRVETSRG